MSEGLSSGNSNLDIDSAFSRAKSFATQNNFDEAHSNLMFAHLESIRSLGEWHDKSCEVIDYVLEFCTQLNINYTTGNCRQYVNEWKQIIQVRYK